MTTRADFSLPPDDQFKTMVTGGSALTTTHEGWKFANQPRDHGYTNAQIDDYQGLPRRRFPWQPPLTMRVRARFSHPPQGTAGFGFWNDPFMMTGFRLPALPRALWFFYASPPSEMKLALDVPGHGWKATTIDAIRPLFFLLAPTAPLAIPLMNIKPLYRRLWPVGQRAIGVTEKVLEVDMTGWHTYHIDWGADQAVFRVDDTLVLACDTPPRGKLGFVMWIDNQAMTVTPGGKFRWQTVPVEREQGMEVSELTITHKNSS